MNRLQRLDDDLGVTRSQRTQVVGIAGEDHPTAHLDRGGDDHRVDRLARPSRAQKPNRNAAVPVRCRSRGGRRFPS